MQPPHRRIDTPTDGPTNQKMKRAISLLVCRQTDRPTENSCLLVGRLASRRSKGKENAENRVWEKVNLKKRPSANQSVGELEVWEEMTQENETIGRSEDQERGIHNEKGKIRKVGSYTGK